MIASFQFNETSPSSASTVASSGSVMNAANYLPAGVAGPMDDMIQFNAIAQLQGGTGGTLDVFLQASETGSTWFDIAHFPQLSAGASSILYGCALGEGYTSIIQIGTGLSPVLAADTVALGGWMTRVRVVFVAGAGTSAGAAQTIWLRGQKPLYGKP